ncbi:thrombospondin type 3 repeat-containing protein [Vibrio wakamikoensis]|uniref:hypothetical protein n=1 Tax=Vibrio wakamikoensis TaxID=2910251 RepID=UPI003D1ADF7E
MNKPRVFALLAIVHSYSAWASAIDSAQVYWDNDSINNAISVPVEDELNLPWVVYTQKVNTSSLSRGEFDLDGIAHKVNIAVTDSEGNVSPAFSLPMYLRQLPATDTEYGNLVSTVVLARADQAETIAINELEFGVGPSEEATGKVWGVYKGSTQYGAPLTGNQKLALAALDNYAGTQTNAIESNLYLTSERYSPLSSVVTTVDATVNGQALSVDQSWINGSVYSVSYRSPQAFNSANEAVISAEDFDGNEIAMGTNYFGFIDGDNDFIDDRFDDDWDNDGLTNEQEAELGTDPRNPDSDGDGLGDKYEVDNGLDPTDPTDALLDIDGDGLSHLDEVKNGTDPNNADSDGDGVNDGDEVREGTDPLDPDDFKSQAIQEVLTVGDVNRDGASEFVALDKSALPLVNVSVLDAQLATLIEKELDYQFSDVQLIDLTEHYKGEKDYVALFGYIESQNRYTLVILNPANTLSVVKRINWPATLNRVELMSVPDMNSDGVSDFALFGQHKVNGTNQLVVRSGVDGNSLRTFKWVNNWQDPTVIFLPDRNKDGIQEVALFGSHKRSLRNQLFVLSGASGSKLDVYNWGPVWGSGEVEVIPDVNGDGFADVSMFAKRNDDERYQLAIKRGQTKAGMAAFVHWPGEFEAETVQKIKLDDRNQDALDEIGLFGLSLKNGSERYKLWVNSYVKNQRLQNLSWPNSWDSPKVKQVNDLDSDGIREVALIGVNRNSNNLEVSVKSSSTGKQLVLTSLETVLADMTYSSKDMNGNGYNDLVILGKNDDDKVEVIIIDGRNYQQVLLSSELP